MDTQTRVIFGFSMSEASRLETWHIDDEWQMLEMSDKQLYSLPGIGPATVEKIRLRRKQILLAKVPKDPKVIALIEAMA